MTFGVKPRSLAEAAPDQTPGADARLRSLCAAFIASAQARSIEGARLDRMPWSAAVDGGYSELCRGEPAHRSMLVEILSSTPATVFGLLAKAHAVRVYRRDPESELVSYAALADDIIRLFDPATECPAAENLDEPNLRVAAPGLQHVTADA